MADDDDGGQERTFEPTAKRVRDFRERGEVPKSQEVLAAVGLAGGAALLYGLAGVVGEGLREAFQISFSSAQVHHFDESAALSLGGAVLGLLARVLLPVLGGMFVLSAVVGLIQQRLAFPKDPIKFNPSVLNPISGFKEKFMSSKPLVELLKGVLKLALIGSLVFYALWEQRGFLPSLVGLPPSAVVVGLERMAFLVLNRAIPVAFIIAILDYSYEWYRNYEKMKMTREEVKEESKSLEGDPHAKAARKRRAQEIAYAQTIQKVQDADVVITNPDHYAVALRYRRDESPAPIVVAKGVDHLAMKIKAEARRHDIPQVENRPLARRLYRTVKASEPIPEDLYATVAKILAVIWKRRGRRKVGGVPIERRD